MSLSPAVGVLIDQKNTFQKKNTDELPLEISHKAEGGDFVFAWELKDPRSPFWMITKNDFVDRFYYDVLKPRKTKQPQICVQVYSQFFKRA